MYVDANLRLCTNQACDGLASLVSATNVIDLQQNRDVSGEGAFIITVTESFAGSSTPFFAFQVVNDSVSTFLTSSPYPILSQSNVFAPEELVAPSATVKGTQVVLPIPRQTGSLKRYLGVVLYTFSGTFTAGKVTIDYVNDIPNRRMYPNAI